MQITNESLLADLRQTIQDQLAYFDTHIAPLDTEALNWRPDDKSWSTLECLEHLNRTGAFYLPHFERILETGKPATKPTFRPGWMGGYFAKSMAPKVEGVTNKMKTFDKINPLGSDLDRSVLEKHRRQQERMLEVLEGARRLDLGGNRVPTLLPLLKLKYGDALPFIINHLKRHYHQIRAIAAVRPVS